MDFSRRHILTGLAAGTAVLNVFGWPSRAAACSPEMPLERVPGESDAQFEARQQERRRGWERNAQQSLWSRADRVYLARAVAPPEPPELPPPPARPYDPRRDGRPKLLKYNYEPPPMIFRIAKTLEAVSALKGTRPMRLLKVSFDTLGYNCTPLWISDVRDATAGDQFVVFLKGWAVTQENLLETIKVERVVDPRVRAALDDIL